MGNIYNWSQSVYNAYAFEIEKKIENVHDNFIHA